MHELIRTVRENIPEGTVRILAGISGGADSVALLRALCLIPGIAVEAVHCNFGLRGEEALRDERFATELCSGLGVPLRVIRFDAAAEARARGISVEMACRDLRYDAFRKLAAELHCQRIAVGHHLDDNIETMLLNLFRGTGIRGLAGMEPDTGEIIRPMLGAPRSLIYDFLDSIGQDYITDSSNLSDAYRRNYIRNTLIPALEERWPGIRKSLARTQANLRSDSSLLDSCSAGLLDTDSEEIPTALLMKSGKEAAATLINRFVGRHGGNGIQAREIAESAFGARYPRRWPMPDGSEAVLDRHRLFIRQATPAPSANECHPFSESTVELTPDMMRRIMSDRSNTLLYSPVSLSELIFRHPLPADRIAPLGMKGTRLVSDILKDLHIPATERGEIWVATDRKGRLIWIEGARRSRHLLLDAGRDRFIHIIGRAPSAKAPK